MINFDRCLLYDLQILMPSCVVDYFEFRWCVANARRGSLMSGHLSSYISLCPLCPLWRKIRILFYFRSACRVYSGSLLSAKMGLKRAKRWRPLTTGTLAQSSPTSGWA